MRKKIAVYIFAGISSLCMGEEVWRRPPCCKLKARRAAKRERGTSISFHEIKSYRSCLLLPPSIPDLDGPKVYIPPDWYLLSSQCQISYVNCLFFRRKKIFNRISPPNDNHDNLKKFFPFSKMLIFAFVTIVHHSFVIALLS